MNDTDFSVKLLRWHKKFGRQDLPWQQPRDAYRVWVSEIMLQQTQVATVIPYFERFMLLWPDVKALAAAALDEVMGAWTGLGYYARARNMHQAALSVVQHHGAEMPLKFDALIELPGIGRSTANAILAFMTNKHHAILDGNVKRVLCRYGAIEGWPGQSSVQKELWILAEQLTPQSCSGDYAQAIMDLGALLCTSKNPDCLRCPVQPACQAYKMQRTQELPMPKPRKKLPLRNTHFIMMIHQHTSSQYQLMLSKRAPTGLWGGLWSFPECEAELSVPELCENQHGFKVGHIVAGQMFRHTFSHFHLDITPLFVYGERLTNRVSDDAGKTLWYSPAQNSGKNIEQDFGVPAPVKKLLQKFFNEKTSRSQ